jgi:hypothetical protein
MMNAVEEAKKLRIGGRGVSVSKKMRPLTEVIEMAVMPDQRRRSLGQDGVDDRSTGGGCKKNIKGAVGIEYQRRGDLSQLSSRDTVSFFVNVRLEQYKVSVVV